ncbi:MAG: hypothetical protein R6T85_12855 [Egibacteraceae bacterium]
MGPEGDSGGVTVALRLPEPTASELAGYVESELGWQVVHPDGPPAPQLVLDEHPAPGVVVVRDRPPDAEEVRALLTAGALDVLTWPGERARLAGLAARVGAGPSGGGDPPVLRLAAVAGGVGASTTALAAAGLLAWSGLDVVAVGDAGLTRLAGMAWQGPGAPELAALAPHEAAEELAALARPARGLPGLRLLGGGPVVDAPGWGTDAVVVDLGVAVGDAASVADLLLARPDAHLAAAAGRSEPVLLLGDGPLDAAGARRALGRRPLGHLPSSARVARAGLDGRVPAGLPGSWLRRLERALREVEVGRR